jgi:hypothetical protein
MFTLNKTVGSREEETRSDGNSKAYGEDKWHGKVFYICQLAEVINIGAVSAYRALCRRVRQIHGGSR